ncbi:unnamed protein product, partial [Nippostrongylus brasiliensis]|uniref:Protein tweety homolog n=1 Tax=Nippostrongylus brasiliensis TaxID=27835 RepID=A0A0N4Y4B6_NIPBR
ENISLIQNNYYEQEHIPIYLELTCFSESYKFIRMADDLHDVATYLADMRLCFILVTATGYLLLFVYLIMRGHSNTAPSFMRHGHINHQQTTRLMADQDGSIVKHQIPHITTEPPADDNKAKVPQLVKDSIES